MINEFMEIESLISPATRPVPDGGTQFLVRVQIIDPMTDPTDTMFIDMTPQDARSIALQILDDADSAEWQTSQDGCPGPIESRAQQAALQAAYNPEWETF